MNYMELSKNLKYLAFIIALGVMSGSCSESDDPSMANIEVEMKAVTSASVISKSGRTVNSGLTFKEVLLGVSELEFEMNDDDGDDDGDDDDNSDDRIADDDDSDDNGDDDEVEFEGQYIVDLIAGSSQPELGIANLRPGLYEEIEIELEPFLDGGHSLYVAFEYMPEGATEPVSVIFTDDDEVEIEIENDAGILLEGGDLKQVLLLLDLDLLFSGIDLDNAEADNDGVVRINDESNSGLAAKIESNFENALEAEDDDD